MAAAIDRVYTYRVPDGLTLGPGDIVAVPLGKRLVLGAVWDNDPDPVDPAKLRDIEQVFDVPPLSAEMRRFVDWIARYYVSPPGMVLRMVLRSEEGLAPPAPRLGLRASGTEPGRMTPQRARVLEMLKDGFAWERRALADATGVGVSVIDGLKTAGALQTVELPALPAVDPPDPERITPVLTEEQQAAVGDLRSMVEAGGHGVALLDGVTGAGKTEVYFEAIAETLRRGRQALILLPEIALTEAFLERFQRRFGARPGEWHSNVAVNKRGTVWRGAATGAVKVVAGARSALFLPFQSLGLIVVDEEHDAAYKQEDRVPYQARDMAVLRGHLEDFPVILSSATPSVESRANADQGRYARIILPQRYGGTKLPEITAIDLRETPPEAGRFLSQPLVEAVAETLDAGEQSLLFLNRRGYAPLTLCRRCGHRFECPNCTAWLVEHRFRRQLLCHHCGFSGPVPDACPSCGAEESLVACGPGVERIAEEVADRFPEARIAILSSDIVPGPRAMRDLLKMIADGGADIVIGTQLAAKGHNFPMMTLVGVVDADLGLATNDPRGGERTFQVLEQVIGRAGRVRDGARAMVQSYDPGHPILKALIQRDREGFYARELDARREAGMPPFGRLAGLIVSAKARADAETHARALVRAAPATDRVRLLGPADPVFPLLRGRHRIRLLAKADRQFDLPGYLRAWIAAGPRERGNLRVFVDVDPQSFF